MLHSVPVLNQTGPPRTPRAHHRPPLDCVDPVSAGQRHARNGARPGPAHRHGRSNKPGELTIERAMAARENPLGAYYRLRPNIVDYHAALNEVDAIYVSGRVHSGWNNPKKSGQGLAIIQPNPQPTGGHAFAIVGYNELGFIVQNSHRPRAAGPAAESGSSSGAPPPAVGAAGFN